MNDEKIQVGDLVYNEYEQEAFIYLGKDSQGHNCWWSFELQQLLRGEICADDVVLSRFKDANE